MMNRCGKSCARRDIESLLKAKRRVYLSRRDIKEEGSEVKLKRSG